MKPHSTWSTTVVARATDPLQKLMALFEGVSAASARESRAQELAGLPLFDRLERRIVDGERNGLDDDLTEAMTVKSPIEIINETLLFRA